MQQITAQLGKPIYCECYMREYSRYKILGSVTSEGIIEILRGHKNKTIIEARELMIACPDCNYKRYLVIESMALKRPTYEKQ